MKNIIVLVMVLGLLFAACGSGEEQTQQPGDTESGEVHGENGEDEPVADTPAVEEVVAEEPLYPEGKIDPANLNAETVVNAAALNEAYYAWDSLKVTLQGYPYIFYGDSVTVEDELELVAQPGGEDVLVTVSFDGSPEKVLAGDRPVTVSGTVEYYWTGDLMLNGGEIIEDAPPAEAGLETSPYAYDGETPILVEEFCDMYYYALIGKEVIVEGYYMSTTTSTTDYGETIRIDLSVPSDSYKRYAACEMTGPVPADTDSMIVLEREGVRIRGTIVGESYDAVGLENCEVINR